MTSEMPPNNLVVTKVAVEVENNKSSIDQMEANEATLGNNETMSKKQRKKLMKQKQWEEQRDLRRYGLFLVSWIRFMTNSGDDQILLWKRMEGLAKLCWPNSGLGFTCI